MPPPPDEIDRVYAFWFGDAPARHAGEAEAKMRRWYGDGASMDAEIKEKFGSGSVCWGRLDARRVLALEALHRSPRLDQRAVDGEVLLAHQPVVTRLPHGRPEELRRHVVSSSRLRFAEKVLWSKDSSTMFMSLRGGVAHPCRALLG